VISVRRTRADWQEARPAPNCSVATVNALLAATDPDRAAAKRAMSAMMTMRKIDIAAIEVARAKRWRSSDNLIYGLPQSSKSASAQYRQSGDSIVAVKQWNKMFLTILLYTILL
jgi:hypothetical protein